jgi:acyl carrier protein
MTLAENVLQLVTERVHRPVDGSTGLRDLGDGLLFLEILMLAEDRFDLEISDVDAERFSTVRDLIDHIGHAVGEPV